MLRIRSLAVKHLNANVNVMTTFLHMGLTILSAYASILIKNMTFIRGNALEKNAQTAMVLRVLGHALVVKNLETM